MTSLESLLLDDSLLYLEMARPLVHECNNFLNILFLQLAISESENPGQLGPEWAHIRESGKNLAGLLKIWQSLPRLARSDSPGLDALALLQELAAEFNSNHIVLVPIVACDQPPVLGESSGQVKQLCRLLLRYAVAEVGLALPTTPARVEVAVDSAPGLVTFRLQQVGADSVVLDWAAFRAPRQGSNTSLLVAACESLKTRIGGSMTVKKSATDRWALCLSVPNDDR
jgi:hypothetical protein